MKNFGFLDIIKKNYKKRLLELVFCWEALVVQRQAQRAVLRQQELRRQLLWRWVRRQRVLL